MFCKHKWKVVKVTYAPPKDDSEAPNFTGRGIEGARIASIMLFGMTTVLMKCTKCQKIEKFELIGKKVEDEQKEEIEEQMEDDL